MASYYLFEPVACSPGAGWEKGQVERQVEVARRNMFTPLLRVTSFEQLNAQLRNDCLEWAKKTMHPEQRDQTIWSVYQQEHESLLAYRGKFDNCKFEVGVVQSTALVNFETNVYSVDSRYVRKQVELRVYHDRLVIYCGDQLIGEHQRCFKRHQYRYDPWHYVPTLAKKPGALAMALLSKTGNYRQGWPK